MGFLDDFRTGPFALTRHRDEMPQYSRVATGDIFPSRFVMLDTSAPGRVKQAISGQLLYGISQAEVRGAPYRPSLTGIETRAAADGDRLFIFGPNGRDVLLTYGGQIAIGDRLTSDNSGQGVKALSPNDLILAVAQERGAAGMIRKVTIITSQRRK